MTAVADDEQPPGAADSAPGELGADDEEALATLYEDHTAPEPVPAEAFNPPPPIQQRQSNLLNILHDFNEGKQDWAVTKSELVAFRYAQREKAEGSPVGPDAGAWWSDTESIAMGPAADDTWKQLQEATNAGMLTRAQLDEVHAGISARSKQPRSTESEGEPQNPSEPAATSGEPADTSGEPAAT